MYAVRQCFVVSVISMAIMTGVFCTRTWEGPGKEPSFLEHEFNMTTNNNAENVTWFLRRFGWLPMNLSMDEDPTPAQLNQGLREFQEFTHLPVTGVVDIATLALMNQRRCGCPDRGEELKKMMMDNGRGTNIVRRSLLGPQAFQLGPKWRKTSLTWKLEKSTPQLTVADQRRAFRKAFVVWEEQTPLRFREVSSSQSADIVIRFGKGNHGDRYAFDGPGSVLAHAFFPENGRAHFDEDEKWTAFSNDGIDLFTVAAHEFGHSLGLFHTNVQGALMAPYYAGYKPNFRLHYDDIRGIQTHYGGATTRPVTTPRPTQAPTAAPRVTPRPTPQPTHRPDPPQPPKPKPTNIHCETTFDDVIQGPDSYLYAFSGSSIYRMDNEGVVLGFPKRIQAVFRRGPSRIDAAVYIPRKKKTYIFKGARVWRYTNFHLDGGFPEWVDTNRFLERPRAAAMFENRLFIFGNTLFWEWDVENEQVPGGTYYPKEISAYWAPVNGIDAVTSHTDGFTYMFKGRQYYKTYQFKVLDGYPKSLAPAWLGANCGSAVK